VQQVEKVVMRDFLQDRQRGTRSKRLMAVRLAPMVFVAAPTAHAINLRSTALGHDSSGVGIAF